MLVQFSVDNFLSFDEEQIFSLVATAGEQHRTHLVPETPRRGSALLRAAALYGANGSGKSNFIQAMRFAKNLIVEGTRTGQAIAVRPFKLDKQTERSSKFEFVLYAQGTLYNYGFRLDSRRIQEEWLYATPGKQEVKLFERTTSPEGNTEVTTGATLSGRRPKQKQFLEFVAQATRPNQLFLTQAIESNVAELKPLFDWFQYTCLILSAEATSRDVEGRAHTNPAFIGFLSRFLCAADIGIENVTTREEPFNFDRYVPEMPSVQRQEVKAIVAAMPKGYMTTVRSTSGERYALKPGEHGEPILIRFDMQHRSKEGQHIPFEIHEESDGTQRLIHLLPALYSFQEDAERVVIVDELDSRLHPLVSRLVVQAAATEGNKSQLVFTTHDTNLLDLELLRRDEIWFVEKDKGGASHLYSLAEFKTRADLKIEKGYLNGRFGAIPFIGNIELLTGHLEEEQAGTTE